MSTGKSIYIASAADGILGHSCIVSMAAKGAWMPKYAKEGWKRGEGVGESVKILKI